MLEKRRMTGDFPMRVFLACAIIITAAVGLAGCFHHQQATYAEPVSHAPLK
jgi:hypothetical protein